jgi:hypothetical protein
LDDEAEITLDGLTYARSVAAPVAGTRGTLKVNGTLMLYDKDNPFASNNYVGSVNVQYVASKAMVPGFGVVLADTDIKALKILSWSQN